MGGADAPPVSTNGSSQMSDTSMDPRSMLQAVMNEKGVTLEKIKTKLSSEGFDDISSLDDIPKLKTFELIERLKKVKTR